MGRACVRGREGRGREVCVRGGEGKGGLCERRGGEGRPVEVRLALNTVQPPFFIECFFRQLLLQFRSSATFRLYYSIQTTTTILT